jgi:23S rRNA pseudouridine1911/1915/1917 synthase
MTVTVKTRTDLQTFLLSLGFKRNRVKKLLKFGAISVNGKRVRIYNHPLSEGDKVSIIPKKDLSKDILKRFRIKILFEDDHIIVIDKPAGLLSISTEEEKERTAYRILNEYLKAKGQRVFIVHRLDRDTSGIMVFAKTEEAKRRLQERWHETEKKYIALVEGIPEKKEGVITSKLKESKTLLVYETDSRDAKPSATAYKVLKTAIGYSLLELKLLTGRKNQIRVHLSGIGVPVAGDKKYGAKTNPFNRLCLHAWRLSLTHPVTGKKLIFESKIPFILLRLFNNP